MVRPGESVGAGLARAFASLPAGARLAVAGALGLLASLALPWYGTEFNELSTTGLASFDFAHLAIVVTVGCVLLLCARLAANRGLPRPLRESELLTAAGAWAALLVGYLMVDRPDELGGSTRVGLRLGIFVALTAAMTIAAGGLRMRREESAIDRASDEPPADEADV